MAAAGSRSRTAGLAARWLVLIAVSLASIPADAHARALVAMVGDSLTWGGTVAPPRIAATQASTEPARSLAALLALLPASSRWHGAEVVNLGVPGTTTADWIETFPERLCSQRKTEAAVTPLLTQTCIRRSPIVDAVAPALGRSPDAVLVLLGHNDALVHLPVEHTATNLSRLVEKLAPARVFVAPMIRPPMPPGTIFADELHRLLAERGILNGPEWPALPTVDGIHLTEGGYAALAALWLDVLRKNDP